MTVAVNVNSEAHLIKLAMLSRLQYIPPFAGQVVRFARSRARAIQPEHVPFIGCYLVEEGLTPDGDPNAAQPRFTNRITLGISYIVQDNDPDEAEELLDRGFQSVMNLLHDPRWQYFPNDQVIVEAITGGNRTHHFGNLGGNQNELPIAEMRMELNFTYRTFYDPLITDIFKVFHMETVPGPPEPGVKPIITQWDLWDSPEQ